MKWLVHKSYTITLETIIEAEDEETAYKAAKKINEEDYEFEDHDIPDFYVTPYDEK